ncbi:MULTISPECIES: TlpA disulfide reductase family protein [Pseudomonas]|uniref:TlpA disulfide reductase family protein n=1 Tax=Pseudomonas TaxID=286 RepID=UPI0004700D71|nr:MULTISPECIES: TlpA disulfide reductase family protein [Pseudomonas]AVO60562.1 TlpA family protein disulfide reductase [Pseudomonas chlororaphis subsp. piscium]AZC52455.1 Thioredoxin [Pseudomonas chlororaphis subsp. piscium]AZC58829.1 Thioredoxin [Pseudomonas chlororaphis subsp. piscium]AZC65039.1 Thioredoxin [Pseudomonas chlororaphis subsp. piscium]AZC71280.1 Thioredoxin [Pseudomonas chlororaphis subsp. piscium]
MARQLAAALAIIGTLLLSGCGNDYGVDQYGQKVAAERVDKQWLVLNYWAEWCGPCRTEIPELNALAEGLKGQSVSVLGVNFDNVQGEELKSASEKLGIKFTVLAQNPAEIFDLPRSEGLPVTYIIDDQGKVREQLMGEQTAAGVMAKLEALRGH